MYRIDFIFTDSGKLTQSFGITESSGDWGKTYGSCLLDAKRRAGINTEDPYIHVYKKLGESVLDTDKLQVGRSQWWITEAPQDALVRWYTPEDVAQFATGTHTVIRTRNGNNDFAFSGTLDECRTWMNQRFMQ